MEKRIMEIQTTLSKLKAMKLNGFVTALEEQLTTSQISELNFEDRLGLLVDREESYRRDKRFQSKLRTAKLRNPQATLEDIDFSTARGLKKSLIMSFSSCDWLKEKQNIFLTGATGVGKTYLACALSQRACLEGFSYRYLRVPKLLNEIKISRADGSYARLMEKYSKIDLLILDDWGLSRLTEEQSRDFLELVEDRSGLKSLIITSQVPVEKWYEVIGEPTLADAILDRLVHRAHKINLTGESLRKLKSQLTRKGVIK